MTEQPQQGQGRANAAAASGTPSAEGPGAISDSQLRSVIQQAAKRGPRPPRTAAGNATSAAGAATRLTLRHAPALRRIPVERASRPQMLLAAVAFLVHWAVTITASILYEHFRPTTTEPTQFITLLISSLTVFTAALVAFIELAKFTRAGRSVAIGLAFINLLIFAAVAIYARHWLIVAAQLVFALGLLALLTGRRGEEEADAPADADNAATPSARPGPGPRRNTWLPVTTGLVTVLLAWCMLLLPALVYASLRTETEQQFDAVRAAHEAGTFDETHAAQAAQARDDLLWLTRMADLVGETQARKAGYLLRRGTLEALLGEVRPALDTIDAAQRIYPTDDGYHLRAMVYCMLHELPFHPSLSEDELAEEEPPPGHVVPQRRRVVIRGYNPESGISMFD